MNTYKQQMKGGMDALMNVNDGLFDVFLCYWLGYIYVEKRQGNRKTFMYICFVPLNNTQLTI